MSSNVGLSTPRGSGTSGYVQRNSAFIKPRAQGYGAPYPPQAPKDPPSNSILEHDRRRAIEVRVMEERERLEEENERIEEAQSKDKKKKGKDVEEGEESERVLNEEEIDERCEVLRQRLLKELEERGDVEERKGKSGGEGSLAAQVHELAEAKIEESERLRRALGIREDRETGEISSSRERRGREGRD
ncbi:mRNA splicing factor [Penicillium chermesinum]|nr:mRNA splicing factor [Penicillium chermesinum]